MDAHSIFRKLTRGAKFSKPTNRTPKTEQQNTLVGVPIKSEKIQIKTEAEDNGTAVNSFGESYLQATNGADNDGDPLTLLGSITSAPNVKKRKALKHLEEGDIEKKKIKLHQEKINQFRNQHHISVVGRHVAEPIESFEQLNVDDDLIGNIKRCSYDQPTNIQKQAIPIMLANRQLLACAPTGSGKSAAFLVPIIQTLKGPQKQGFRAVIVCPTRELAKQIQRECLRLSGNRGLHIHIISKISKALAQYGPKSSQNFDILVTTPNRLCYLLEQDPPAISLENVQWLIIDEADKLFELGVQSFRDQLEKILTACNNKQRRIAMFSATHTPAVAKWCCHNMRGLIRVTVGQRNSATDLVDQELLFVGSEAGKLIAFRDIVRKGITPPVLVFVQSKERAQQLFNELVYDGINVDAIHADRTQTQRDDTVRKFREGQVWVLIATELMARGIDFKGINLVINYDFPQTSISYIHRVGRAGRAGRRGKAITFFTVEDTVNLRSIAQVIRQSGCEVPEYMLALKKRSKKEIKKLKTSAPDRADISTVPIYEVYKKMKHRDQRRKTSRTEEKGDPADKTGKAVSPKGKQVKKHFVKLPNKGVGKVKLLAKKKESKKNYVKLPSKGAGKLGNKGKPLKKNKKNVVRVANKGVDE